MFTVIRKFCLSVWQDTTLRFNPVFRIEKWLWSMGLGHPQVMPIIRNEILLSVSTLLCGLLLFLWDNWLFWFGVGAAIMAWTFFALARFFIRTDFSGFRSQLLLSVLVRWTGRFLLTVLLLYVALVLCAAPVLAILSGFVSASLVALVTYAQAKKS